MNDMFGSMRSRTGASMRGGGDSNLNSMAKEAFGKYLKNQQAPPGAYSSQTSGMKADVTPKGYKKGGLQQFDKKQMGLYNRLFEFLGPDSYLAKLAQGNPELFQELEAPAMRQFSGLQGQMASRFSQGGGQGSLSGRRSSGFQNEGTSAAANFAEQLQAQRQGLQMNAINEMQRLSHALLSERPYEKAFFAKPQKQKTDWGSVVGNLTGQAASAAANYFAPGSGAVVQPAVQGAISNF